MQMDTNYPGKILGDTMKQNTIEPVGLALAFGTTWGLSILTIGMLHHITGLGSSFMASIDYLYPGQGTGLKGVLIGMIFGITHAAISGAIIASIYNAYQKLAHEQSSSL